MTDKQDKRNFDPERMEQNEFNTGENSSDYDGGHPDDSQLENDDKIKNGEDYARRQHGKDEIEDNSFNAGGNDSDYDGGHPEDSASKTEGKIDSDKN